MSNKANKAWALYEQGEHLKAQALWEEITHACPSDENLSLYCYTLCALHEFERARNIYTELWERTKYHRYLHQLAMVEREAGNYKKALDYILKEATLIKTDDVLDRSANLYEQCKINQLLGNINKALELAHKCDELSQCTTDLIMKGCAKRLLGDIFNLNDNSQLNEAYLKSASYFSQARDYIGRDEVLKKLNGFIVESPTLRDANDLYQIELDNYGETESTEFEVFEEILLSLKNSTFYQIKKVSLNEEIIGFYCLVFENENTPDLVDMTVSKKYQNLGIGTILMSFMLQDISKSVASVGLLVRASNGSAIKLYNNFGFKQIERIEDHYEDGEAALKMRLEVKVQST